MWLLPPLGELIADHGIAGRVIHAPAGARTGSRQGQDRPDFYVIPLHMRLLFPQELPLLVEMGAFDCWHVTVTSTAAHLGDRVIVKFAIANSTDPWQQIKTAHRVITHRQSNVSYRGG